MEVLIDGLEGHLTRAVVISGVLALLIVGAVWLLWARSRHWVDRGRTSLATNRHTSLTSRTDEPPPPRPGGEARPSGEGRARGEARPGDENRPSGEDPLASRLVREAALRAAALREAWDRSYREARGPAAAPEAVPPDADLRTRLDQLLREQRETNALLRQLVDRLGQRDS